MWPTLLEVAKGPWDRSCQSISLPPSGQWGGRENAQDSQQSHCQICRHKGNWAAIVPMALYFLRCTPNNATGFSLFVVRFGWEPTTPLLMYKGWVQSDLGAVDLEEWVLTNAERVEKLTELAVVRQKDTSSERKKAWDCRAQRRKFAKGDLVYARKTGTNTKLSESWEGPFKVERKNSPLSYQVNLGDRNLPSVHIQHFKEL